jgi:D-glycero-D-manno-heptose 1,7-bisphosphate phosphatase
MAYTTDHRYYSVGSFERLPLTEAFLEPQKAVILDRDGVLNERPPQAHYVLNWSEFKWLPGAAEAMGMLSQAGYKLLVATNQPGIARGMLTEQELNGLHEHMRQDLSRSGVHLDAIYHCPHGWDEGCFCRKPSPGMLFQAQREFHLDLTKTLFIGDDERDEEAGRAAGCNTALVTPERSLLDVVRDFLKT